MEHLRDCADFLAGMAEATTHDSSTGGATVHLDYFIDREFSQRKTLGAMSRFARKERPPPGFEILEPTLTALEYELRESE